MKKSLARFLFRPCVLLAVLLAAGACRKELPMIRSEVDYVALPTTPERIEGFFLLNEGNMGSNKCTIDHFDARSGGYRRNIYPERNPGVVKELGDVGNDLAIHDRRLYAVVNCSNLVEVMDVYTAEHIGSISIPNCRYIVFEGDRAYVSSYAGPVQIDPEARPGKVVEIDTRTLEITREVTVGYQPEEMVITGGRLYVANSGGYRFPDYDRTVSVIDLDSFEVVNTIDVTINLHRMELDRYGRIYVSSRGDYYGTGSDIYVIDSFEIGRATRPRSASSAASASPPARCASTTTGSTSSAPSGATRRSRTKSHIPSTTPPRNASSRTTSSQTAPTGRLHCPTAWRSIPRPRSSTSATPPTT